MPSDVELFKMHAEFIEGGKYDWFWTLTSSDNGMMLANGVHRNLTLEELTELLLKLSASLSDRYDCSIEMALAYECELTRHLFDKFYSTFYQNDVDPLKFSSITVFFSGGDNQPVVYGVPC